MKKYIGITLFEMLLVLFISGMIAIAAFKAQQEQNRVDVSDTLARNMYIFSQTVRAYVNDNQVAITAGTFKPSPSVSDFQETGTAPNKTYTFTGVDWLKQMSKPNMNVTYLGSDFSFNNLQPLVLKRIDAGANLEGDQSIKVTISGGNVTIDYGLLYFETANQTPQVEASITAMAAKKAQRMYDPELGPSSFNYTGGLNAQGHPLSIQATTSGMSAAADSYMRADGSVEMTGSLQFNDDTPGSGNADIDGVENINFDPKSTDSAITGLDSVQFSSAVPGTMKGVATVDFSDDSEINNLDELNFDSDDGEINNLGKLDLSDDGEINLNNGNINDTSNINFANNGAINNIRVINFSNNSSFGGITNINEFRHGDMAATRSGDVVGPTIVEISGKKANTKTHFCALNSVRFNDGNSNANRACNLIVNNDGNYTLEADYALSCSVMCFKYSP